MVTLETLRKWSFAGMIDHLCSKDYDLTGDDGNVIFKFKAGDCAWFPVVGLQMKDTLKIPAHLIPNVSMTKIKTTLRHTVICPFVWAHRMCIGE